MLHTLQGRVFKVVIPTTGICAGGCKCVNDLGIGPCGVLKIIVYYKNERWVSSKLAFKVCDFYPNTFKAEK